MKKSITTLLCMLMFCCTVLAQQADADSLTLGNCQGRGVAFLSSKSDGGALYYPEQTMKMYTGNRLTDIYVYIGVPANMVKNMNVFLAGDSPETPFYTQPAQPAKIGWNRIVLDTPYEIDGSGLYIGFTAEGLSISMAEKTADNAEYIRTDGTWEKSESIYSLALYAIVKGDNLPEYDAGWICDTPFAYAVTGNNIAVSGTVRNLAMENITNLKFIYRYGDTEQAETVEGLDIPYMGEARISLTGPQPEESGEYVMTVELTEINGHEDLNPSDNMSDGYAISVIRPEDFVQRNVILEVFSTESCPNCPEGHRVLDSATAGSDRIIEIGHHSAFYTDDYTIDASIAYEWFFNSMKYAPSILVNRTGFYDRFPDDYRNGPIAPVCGIGSSTEGILNDALNTPAMADIHLEVTSAEDNVRDLTINVSGDRLLPLPDDRDDRLYVFVTEDSIATTTQSGASGVYYHRHTIRQCLTDTWGDGIDLDNGFEKQYHLTVPEQWNMSRIAVVAFAGNYNPDDIFDCRIYNGAEHKLKYLLPAGLNGISAENVYTDGRTLIVPQCYSNVSIYDSKGVCVLQCNDNAGTVGLEQLPAGLYIYTANGSNVNRNGKILLK